MRRGQAEMLEWFPRMFLMAVAVIIIVMLVRVYTNRDVDAPDLHRAAYLYRLYYDDVIMFSDVKTHRVYPGIVDVSKLTPKHLDDIFSEKPPGQDWAKISSRIDVIPIKGCAIAPVTIYNNELTYDKYVLLTDVQFGGGATREDAVFPVTLKDGTRTCAGQLNITIVRPNS